MYKIETNRKKIVKFLNELGWISVGGKAHEKFILNNNHISVPYSREIAIGTARQIIKKVSS